MSEEETISYVVSSGEEAGIVLTPHIHDDGKYVASMTRFERDYVRVESLREVSILARHGFSIRMSNKNSVNHRAASLISPSSLQIAMQ